MLGGDALDLEIAIGEVRRDLAKGFIWFLSGSNPNDVFAAWTPATLPSPSNGLVRYAACG
jgi:hypothetical protein